MTEFTHGARQTGVTVTEMITYILIVIVLAAVNYGKYVNSSLDKAISEALTEKCPNLVQRLVWKSSRRPAF